MTDTNQLPPHTITIHDHPEPHIMQWSDLELAAVKRYAEQYALQARAILALHPAAAPMTPLTDAQMENGRDQIFSINNPYCPCDRKTFKKVAQWVERHHKIGITAQCANTTKKEGAT